MIRSTSLRTESPTRSEVVYYHNERNGGGEEGQSERLRDGVRSPELRIKLLDVRDIC